MKYTAILITVLSVTSTWGIKAKIEDPKDKRDASADYAPSGHSSHSYQTPSLGQDEGNAISIGAGYSVGGAKPSYIYSSQGAQAAESPYQMQSEGLSGGQTYQLAPITLQPSQSLASDDLSELMNQLSHGISSGAISLPGGQGQTYQLEGQGAQGGQYAAPQFSFGSPKLAQYSLGGQQASLPLYATNTKGLGNFGSTGPVLFTPQAYSGQAQSSQGASSGQAYESATINLGEKGYSFPGISLSGGAHSLGASYKAIPGNYAAPGKGSFKPSTFVGASIPSDSSHGLSGHSAAYSAPSFANYHSPAGGFGGLSLSSGGHGVSSFGGHGTPAKLTMGSFEGLGSLESIASAFSHSGQIASPPRTTYGHPSGAHSSSNIHAASAQAPQYYISSKYPSSGSFSSGHSFKAPVSHGSLNSFSSGPKYSFGGHSHGSGGHSHYSPKDTQGSYSESSYNTIKYSEDLKPRIH